MRHFPVIAAGALLVSGCGVQYPDPVVTDVSPSRGWNGTETVVDITGRHFYPQVWVEAGGRDQDRVDDDFSAFLVDDAGEVFQLSGSVSGYTRFEAVVGSGLTPGLYDVVVESATGRRGLLEDAFTVSDSIADRLVLEPIVPSAVVETAIGVDVYLADPLGDRVHEPGLAVELWLEEQLTGATYAEAIVITTDIAIQPGTGSGRVVGVLGEQARVNVTVPDPGLYVLHVAAQRDADVSADSVLLEWEAGSLAGVSLTLPTPGFAARVGEPFDLDLAWVDLLGNPVPSHVDTVLLESTCSGFLGEVTVAGSLTHTVTLTRPCAADAIFDNRDSDARTPDFAVLPTDPDHLEVSVPPPPFVAGVPFPVQVVAYDPFDNAVDWTGTLALSLDSGGAQGAACSKNPFNLGQYDCIVTATVAAGAVVLRADGGTGLSGTSAAFQVDPNPGALGAVAVTVVGLPRAGEPHLVQGRVTDAWGNTVDAGTWAPADWRAGDELDDAVCTWNGVVGGAAEFSCVPTVARAGCVAEVELVAGGVSGTSVAFTVFNGELARVDVAVPGGAAIVAGAPFALSLAGFDAFGNPATLLVDTGIDLSDDTGRLAPSYAALAFGNVNLSATLDRAGNTVVRAAQAGLELGVSEVLTVAPAATSALRLTVLDAPWAWSGMPVGVRVEAVDAFGNRTAWSGTATLTSRGTPSPSVQVAVTNGVGTGTFTWTGPALDDVIEATGGGWVGEAAPLDVAVDCGAAGPVVSVDFGGFPEAVACVDPVTDLAVTTASFAASQAGGAPLVRYDVAVAGGAVVRSAVAALPVELPGTGIHPLRTLVIDAAGCGDEGTAFGYAGPDDGEAVGPIEVAPDLAQLVAGVDRTPIAVRGLTDCARDLAVGATVYVRTTLGELSGVSPTGEGLAGLTDATGELVPMLDAVPVATGGLAQVVAWVASGAARGEGTVTVLGDNQRPTVWWQDPTGATVAAVSDLVVTFSEPMLAGSLPPGSITLTGPSGANVNGATLDPSGTTLSISVAPAADGADGVWTLTIPFSARDLAGNRLSGDWSGGASEYQGVFGDVAAPVDPVVCAGTTPDDGSFRPDGDDGEGQEADLVWLALATAVAPAWWEVEVRTEVGATLRLERVVPVGASDAWGWDGRDQGGSIVDNGAYEIAVTPVDGLGNRGAGCTASVSVDNSLGSAP